MASQERTARPRRVVAPKQYDRAYFERWYRDPRTRIHQRTAVERKVRLALGAAEYLTQRPVRAVLDVGCGEGPWQPILKRARPGVRYVGVDSSDYAVRRFGHARDLRLGTFGQLSDLGLGGPFDLVVCSDVLHYVPDEEVRPGLRAIADLLGGLAWLEFFTDADAIAGDFHEMKRRPPAFYDRALRAAGLVHCGLFSFVRADFAPGVTAFERGRCPGRGR